MNLRRLGGIAALVMAAAYLVGCVLNYTLLDTSRQPAPRGRAGVPGLI